MEWFDQVREQRNCVGRKSSTPEVLAMQDLRIVQDAKAAQWEVLTDYTPQDGMCG
jgi:hypothetical protein